MRNIKKLLVSLGAIVLVIFGAIWILGNDLEHIEDTNGETNYALQTITDSNIINMDIGALNLKEKTGFVTNTKTYSSDKFTGVAEIYGTNIKANRFDITVNHAQVNSGNFKMVLVCNDEIVHEFTLNELSQSYTLENPSGYVALRIAGESADFMFDYSID